MSQKKMVVSLEARDMAEGLCPVNHLDQSPDCSLDQQLVEEAIRRHQKE